MGTGYFAQELEYFFTITSVIYHTDPDVKESELVIGLFSAKIQTNKLVLFVTVRFVKWILIYLL